MAVAFSGKFLGSAVAARATGFSWRQSGATGSLMSAKGLIELIVLNQGLQGRFPWCQTCAK
jgi:Kef-type K+ transport system membrane component KefB